MKKTLAFRRTPWDKETVRCAGALVPHDPQSEPPPTPCRIYLQGHWLVDPRTVTAEDAQRFMWDGLRALRREAKMRGITDRQIDNMIQVMFDHFFDAATAIYHALCMLRANPPKHGIKWSGLHHGGHFLWAEPEPECTYVPCVDQWSLEDCQTVPFVEAQTLKEPTHEDWFVACEEDRPVPVTVRYRKREPLLDPDRNLLESFEP